MTHSNWPEDLNPCPQCGKMEGVAMDREENFDVHCDPMFNGGNPKIIPSFSLRCLSCGFTTSPFIVEIAVMMWNSYTGRLA